MIFRPQEHRETQIAYVGLGSNRGDSPRTLVSAVKMLDEADGVDVVRISQFHRTEPVGGPPDQPAYLNAAAVIETTLTPEELLDVLHRIEAAHGRERSKEQRWGPRTCDLDLLMMGETVLDTDRLTIPHPRLHERLFVLEPLAQVAPEAVHPVLGKTVTEMLIEAEAEK